MSMVTWEEDKWTSKDGMEAEPVTLCANKWLDYPGESDNDWTVVPTPPYSEASKTLQGKFSRKMMGSSMDDLAFRVNY